MSTMTEKYRTVADLRDARRRAIGELAQEEESDWAEQLDLLWDDMTDDERCEVDPGWSRSSRDSARCASYGRLT